MTDLENNVDPNVQYSQTPLPYHRHNGVDSAQIDIKNILRFPSTPSQGDVVYYDGTMWKNLSAGTAGQLLQTNGANANPSWSNSGIKFGGTGADGALALSSGTTTLNCGTQAVVVKNYTSISITGTGALAFSSAHPNGTVIILKSQGTVTLTASANPLIDLRGVGANGGAGSAGNTSVAGLNTAGTAGNDGSDYGLTGITISRNGKGGSTTDSSSGNPTKNPGGGGASAFTAGTAGANGDGTGGAAGTQLGATLLQMVENPQYTRILYATVGAGGGGGTGGNTGKLAGASTAGGVGGTNASPTGGNSLLVSTSGANQGAASGGGGGGASGGALIIECGGALNFTGTINANGSNGGNSGDATITSGANTATSSGGAGGGGSGGTVIILYNSLTANSGTITTSGGATGTPGAATGGTGNQPGQNGGAGGNGFSLVTQNTVFF